MPTGPASGYFASGVPYRRLGRGPRTLIVLHGLSFEHKPPARAIATLYGFLGDDYTVYNLLPKPHPPRGTTLADMAGDYATTIRDAFEGPVDILGTSTGGSIALYLAADHAGVVRRLVLHSAAHTLSDSAKQVQLEVAAHAEQGRWWKASVVLARMMFPGEGLASALARPLMWLMAGMMALTAPQDPTDLAVTVAAEDRLAFRDRLHEIAAPTLVVGGTRDPFYAPDLFRETAAGIPDATLVLYEGKGHAPGGRQFARDVLAFLRAGGE